MINIKLAKAIIGIAPTEVKNNIILMLLDNIGNNYDYNDRKANHLLEMLVDEKAIITEDRVNIDYIKENLNILYHNPEKYNIKNIKVSAIDNIDCVVKITYDYIDKINEDRADITYINTVNNVSYLDYPNILK